MENIEIEIEQYKVKYLIFDIDIIINTEVILYRVWNEVCECYKFQLLNNVKDRSLLKKTPKEISTVLLKKESSNISIEEILLTYQRFLERSLVTMEIKTNSNFKEYLKQFQQNYQLGLISLVHDKGLVVYFLTIAGLLHIFDVILTPSDISTDLNKNQFDSNQNNEKYQIFYEICSRLESDISKSLFIIDLAIEDKNNLSNFKFMDLTSLPNYTPIYSSSPPSPSPKSSLSIQKQSNSSSIFEKFTLKWLFIWIGVPLISGILWFIMFYFLKSFNTHILTK